MFLTFLCRAAGGVGPYGTSFTLQVLILPILLTKADTHIQIYLLQFISDLAIIKTIR